MTQSAQEPIETTKDLASMASEIELSNTIPMPNKTQLEIIIRAVNFHMPVTEMTLQSKSRRSEFVEPRFIVSYFLRKYTNYSFLYIGKNYFGGKDHSTVLHGVEIVKDRCSYDSKYRQMITQIDDDLQVYFIKK